MADDYYRTLKVSPEATPDEIQRAYRSLALRYHPDRNATASAASMMIVVNKAYEVLSEPAKRADYDREHSRKEGHIDATVLVAAKDALLRQGWTVLGDRNRELILQNRSRKVHVNLVSLLDDSVLERCERSAEGFCAVLAVRIERPLNIAPNSLVVIDLMHSRVFGGDFPDPLYKSLFGTFL